VDITAGRGGGIAGTAFNQELGPVDTTTLTEDDRERIENLVRSVDFFNLPDKFPQSAHVSDAQYHWLRVIEGDQSRKVGWDDNHKPPDELHELVRALEQTGATWRNVPYAPPKS
jgi:emfourin